MHETRALKELQHGSEVALAWFIQNYMPYVSSVVYQVIGQSMSLPDVEEVTADVFVALWNHSTSIRSDTVKSWLATVARNAALNKLRFRGQDVPLEDDTVVLIDSATPESETEKYERQMLVRQAIYAMEMPDREIFLRHYYYYQSVSVIAQEMRLGVSNVKVRLFRGREKLRTVLENLQEGGTDVASKNF